jgi:hypothetical protein
VGFLGLTLAVVASFATNVGHVLQALDAREAPAERALRVSLLALLARKRRWETAAICGAPLAVGMLSMLLGSIAIARTRAVSALVPPGMPSSVATSA